MSRTKTYKVVITPSSNPNAPTFDELMQTEIKEWIKKILEHGVKSGAIKVDLSSNGDKINIENQP
jgi:hypothetical protein